MSRVPFFGLRVFLPRVSSLSRPLLPLARVTSAQTSVFSTRALWRPSLFQMRLYSPFHASSRSRFSSPSRLNTDSGQQSGPGPDVTLSQRLKHLVKTYGWYALGVYFILSTLDFAVAFAAINILGAEQVGHVTRAAKEYLGSLFPRSSSLPDSHGSSADPTPQNGREGLYATIVLAYTVHKTLFLPIRVGLTAVITPKFVNFLVRKGWVGSEGAKRAAREIRERVRQGKDRDK